MTKWVNHVRTVVIWDRDFQDGELAEEELAFMAQDDQGNVWSMGEYPEEHEDGESRPRAPGWRATTAPPPASSCRPTRGPDPAYIQGRSADIEFFDKAKVAKTNQSVCVPVDCYNGVLVVDEWDPTAQPEDGHQFKYHAPGVGVVKIVGKGGVEQERSTLTKLRTLNDDQMAAARDRVFQLDKHAYKLAKDVYANTPFVSLK